MNQIDNTTPAAIVDAPKADKAAPKAAKAAPKAGAQYRIMQGQRPGSGAALYAHTTAALQLLGVTDKTGGSAATLEAILGERAMKHHLATTGFFAHEMKAGKYTGNVVLTYGGSINPHWKQQGPIVEGFKDLLSTGKTSVVGFPASFANPNGIFKL